MSDLSARDGKLVQYLNEAHAKEKELEVALTAHIGMTTRAPYKKRLQDHLSETRRHARELERAVKRLGGNVEVVSMPGPEAVSKGVGAAVALGTQAIAAAKGPLHMIRGTGEQEKMLKNAKTEFSEEHEEIATYTAIEALAETLHDAETAKLARAIRREEQRMAAFLERLIPTLAKAVCQEEVPAAERRAPSRTSSRRRSAGSRRTSTSRRAPRARSRSGTAGATRSAASRSSGRSTSGRSSSGASGASHSAASRSTSGRSTSRSSTPDRSSAARTASRSSSGRSTPRSGSSSRRSTPSRSTASGRSR